jgi:hypothetical protein
MENCLKTPELENWKRLQSTGKLRRAKLQKIKIEVGEAGTPRSRDLDTPPQLNTPSISTVSAVSLLSGPLFVPVYTPLPLNLEHAPHAARELSSESLLGA